MNTPASIVIVGGGTAGWMAANRMIRRWGDTGCRITLVESPDIGIVGVGEGSTPQLKAFFDDIDVAEEDWMPACNATYKVGISFVGWSTRAGFERYFHPFPADTDTKNYRAFVYHCYLRRLGLDVDAHPDRFFVPARLAADKRGPRPDYRFPFPILYGYHFDAHLVGQYLGGVATSRGVRHVQARVTGIAVDERGDIEALILDSGDRLEADYYVDCTGFAGVLLQKRLGVGFESFRDNLFNDSAVVMPTRPSRVPNSQTISTAMRHGWAWDIPLTNRNGNGYVYSSAYCSADEAETELRAKLGLLDSDTEARHLRMQVGQVERHWAANCVAVGLSQGFIEPLEATALHIVDETVTRFIDAVESADRDAGRERFNRLVRERFDGIRNYIVCHYRVNSRTDTDYWRDNAANEALSDSLKSILTTWLDKGDLTVELQRQNVTRYYNSISWHCLLAGYGIFPEPPLEAPAPDDSRPHDLAKIDDFVRRCALNFAPHDEQLRFDNVGTGAVTPNRANV